MSANPWISVVDSDTPEAEHGNPLADLKAALSKPLADQTIVLPVPLRDGWAIRYSTAIPAETMQAWIKKATVKKDADLDMFRFACLCLAAKCTEIIQDGTVWRDGAGEALTFQSRELGEALGVETDVEAVRAVYGSDGHVSAAADKVTRAAGYGDELEPVDPT